MPARLGQHFLTRAETAEKIADAYLLSKKDTVLEVGPGHGILTRALLARVGKVVALEKDQTLFKELLQTFSREMQEEHLVLVKEDVRACVPSDLFPHTPYHVVANIPYYITGQIIRLFLTAEKQPTTLVLLIQKEVAERICAKDGKESVLSLSVKAYGTPRIAFVVKAGAFSPPPKVDSAVLVVEHISRSRFQNKKHEALFFSLLHTAFQEKRKMISGTLKKLVSLETLAKLGIAHARPETLGVEAWTSLAKEVLPR
jgi:16S rRNA (adenine1518-N6/adenine1519-N6)-dimethyltransferase